MDSPAKNPFLHRATLSGLLVLLLAANVACAVQIIRLSQMQARIKQDYAYANSLRYGLFSMDVWREHFERIVSKSITNLQLSPQDEITAKHQIEQVVKIMIAQTDSMLRTGQKTLGGRMRKVAYTALVDVPALMKKSPQFAQAVLNEITKPESLEQLRILAINQLNRYAADTRNNDTDGPPLAQLLATYHVKTIAEFDDAVSPRMKLLHNQIRLMIGFMVASVGVFFMFWWALRNRPDVHTLLFQLSAGLAAIILVTSLSVPMLDIDARIKSIDLNLLGEHIQFSNQILFYRSKSILQVVRILMVSGKGDTAIVGVLLLLFSVIFPLAKLASAILCLSGKARFRANPWVDFFAYRSGKWSMADVMVLAIFMAYIGFNSVLNDQLKGLNVSSESWQMITTNQTALQPGFILFVTFVVFGLALSEILKRIVARDTLPAVRS